MLLNTIFIYYSRIKTDTSQVKYTRFRRNAKVHVEARNEDNYIDRSSLIL